MRHFRKTRVEFSDGTLDLHPVYSEKSHPMLCFNRVHEWIITLSDAQEEIGRICYRDCEGRGIYYFGHIGYHINPSFRGHKYSLCACKLIIPLIRLSGKSSVVITCDSDNIASIHICQHLRCIKERLVKIPEDIAQIFDTGAMKQRYILEVST